MQYFCFIIGIIIVVICAIGAYKKRYNTKKWIAIITFGVLLSVFFMVLPTKWTKENQIVFMEPFYNIISALLYSLKVISGRQDINQINSISFTGAIRYIYLFINYVAFIITPILGSSLILSFVGDTLSKIRYALPSFRKICVFSHLNENSVLIAKGLSKKKNKPIIVFCNTKDSKDSLIESARKLHGITLYKSCDSIKIKKLSKKYEFCAVSENEDENIRIVKKLLKKHNTADELKKQKIQALKEKYPKAAKIINLFEEHIKISAAEINITAFAQSGPNIQLIESMSANSQKINVRFIDKIALFCNNLIFENPLYKTDKNTKNISVMLIGCGTTGLRMLKTAVWSGQIDGYTLKIRVYDKKAKKIEKIFNAQCPELVCNDSEDITENNYDIKFIETDICTEDFEAEIRKNNQLTDATAVYVFTGEDNLNIDVAEHLFRIFRKHRNFSETPPIFTWINDKSKYDILSDDNDYLQKRNIRLVGNVENIFSERAFFGSIPENLALAVHLSYSGMLNASADSHEFKKAVQEFKNSEYNRRASMATALHISAKLHACGILSQDEYELTDEKAAEFGKYIHNNPQELLRLAKNEHLRWNAFMRSEGYSYIDTENIEKIHAQTAQPRDDLSKLHPCLTDWDSLEKTENYCRDILHKNKPFRQYDCNIVKDIPQIIMLANKLSMEEQ